MELILDNVLKPVRQLRKSLKSLSAEPGMKDVHDLRTRARHVEAIAGMLIPGQANSKRQLLKVLKPICKAAGDVRDMDVLAAKARALTGRRRDDSVRCLLDHLQAVRIESSGKLAAAAGERRKDARDRLKQFSRTIEKRLQAIDASAPAKTSSAKPHTEATMRLMDELSRWPAFSEENLHAFRIKVKELRYVLQVAEGADLKFVDALERVKTRVGDWHDWQELRKIAGEVLHPRKHREVLDEIEEIASRKFKPALRAARAVRSSYLGPHRGVLMIEP